MQTDLVTFFKDLLSKNEKATAIVTIPIDCCSIGRTVQAVAEAFLKSEYDKGVCYYCDPYGDYYHCSVKDRSCRHQISFQDIKAELFAYIFWQQKENTVSISPDDLDACWSLVDALIMSGEVENFEWNK